MLCIADVFIMFRHLHIDDTDEPQTLGERRGKRVVQVAESNQPHGKSHKVATKRIQKGFKTLFSPSTSDGAGELHSPVGPF